MPLSGSQLQTLKANIALDAELSALPFTSGSAGVIAAAYNSEAAGPFVVWKTSVAEKDILANGMTWTRVDNLSIGKARIWEWLFKFGTINASKQNIRDGIDAVWVGTQADLDVRASVYTHCKRNATRAEKLFVSGGSGTTLSPATMTFEGAITSDDVQQARELP